MIPQKLEFTGERYVPEVHGNIELEHLHRYLFACKAVSGKVVLDIASGEGYGSAMLARTARQVTGVDISKEVVSHARAKYQYENLSFSVGSCSAIPLEDASIDVVVSFETIEHHGEHEAMMREIKRVLRPGGVLVISSPDKLKYSDEPGYSNPYHVKELYRDEFDQLLDMYFKHHSIYGQRIVYGSAIFREDGPSPIYSYDLVDGTLSAIEGVPCAVYLIAVASDEELPLIESGVLQQPIGESDAVRGQISSFTQLVAERDEQVASLNRAVAERDGQVASLNRAVTERDGQVASLNQAVAERDGQIASLNRAVAERDGQIAEGTEQTENLHKAVLEAEKQFSLVISSKSWRLTKPLRFFRRGFSNGVIGLPYVRKVVSACARAIWTCIPLSILQKRTLKSLLFKHLPVCFRWSRAYQQWKGLIETYPGDPLIHSSGGKKSFPEKVTYVPLLQGKPIEKKPVKLVCFYLPQFHPIPENDAWWGKGFTEWVNVRPAQPLFEGHYQPRVPGELGYYNLLDPIVQRRQVDLAKLYGLGGFCFYFYWFAGKRLLEQPIANYFNDKSLDLPFCLCWANEDWSRRWNGLDGEILIAQHHSPEDDLAFIQHVARYMGDSRYLRIEGKPLLLVYRPARLMSAKETVRRWRDWCRGNDIGEIYLAYTQSFEKVDPEEYGFDAAIEFPPNNSLPPDISYSVTPLKEKLGSTVYDWRVFVERSKKYHHPGYKLFRGVCPSWDNTSRRRNSGASIFINSTPSLYREWLKNAICDTEQRFSKPDEQLIFVNAWNEWAEGAHLEPDTRYGYAYLQATRNALNGGECDLPDEGKKVVLVTHDAYPHGAQFLLLNIAKVLHQGFGFHVDLICLGDGPLKSEYAKWATLHDLAGLDARGPEAVALAKRLYEAGHRSALVNTTAAGYFLETLAINGFTCIALVHELPGVLDNLSLHGQAKSVVDHATRIVFPTEQVAASFKKVVPADAGKIAVRPQGLYKQRDKLFDRGASRKSLRQKLGLADNSQIVLGVGYADSRKGVDLFVEAGLQMASCTCSACWVWIGHWEATMQRAIEEKLSGFPAMKDRFVFPGFQSETELFYDGADVFALTSREDPFPSVVLEALDAELPVVAFEETGGSIELLREGCGRLVAKEDTASFADAVRDILESQNDREVMGKRGAELIQERFSFWHYTFDLLDLLGKGLPKVSVVIPNYNYARYLPERLSSVLSQSHPIFEIIFLDDCSTDESVSIARQILASQPISYKIVVNTKNSGSVFSQWQKGVDAANGTYVWIAEADDSCRSCFLMEVLEPFKIPGVVLSYSESMQIDEEGQVLANNYLAYVADIDVKRWSYPFLREGREEVIEALCIKNTIPNVSGVVFEAKCLRSILNQNIDLIRTYRVVGDWVVYVSMLKNGKIAFSPAALNLHRRHQRGVTIGNLNDRQLFEIHEMQTFVARAFDIPREKIDAAKTYLEHLSQQFATVHLLSDSTE
jgi:O-antigen biosynthesis protein